MTQSSESFVSIVTPVYNGEKYITECIESVLNQTYHNWEYIIVDNCSTDNTHQLSSYYSNKDKRIKLIQPPEHLQIFDNWNYTLRQISSNAKYFKIIHADDWMFPECVSKMVDLLKRNPNVGMVGSYILNGNYVGLDGLPYGTEVYPGVDIARLLFRDELNLFGSPSVYMFPCHVIREGADFYNRDIFVSDADAHLEILKKHDFGFLHQVLSCTRLHEDRQTEKIVKVYGNMLLEFRLGMLLRHGRHFLDHNEFDYLVSERFNEYYKFLARNVIKMRNFDFWKYQHSEQFYGNKQGSCCNLRRS